MEGKKVYSHDFYYKGVRVRSVALYLRRFFRPSRAMEAVAEYYIFRLLKGVEEDEQKHYVDKLIRHNFMSPGQAGSLLKSGRITNHNAKKRLETKAKQAEKEDKARA